MNLYKIERTDKFGYDEYDSAVVAAESEADAKLVHPGYEVDLGSWTDPENVEVTFLGQATIGIPRGVIVASFNAG